MRIEFSLFSLYKKQLVLCAAVALLVIGTLWVANAIVGAAPKQEISHDEHLVTVHDRGVERVIVTKSNTIGEALRAADIEVDATKDVIEPALDEELVSSKYNVNIYRARPVTIVDGKKRYKVTTAHQTPEQVAKAAGVTIHPEDKVSTEVGENLLLDGASLVMDVDRATELTFVLYGKESTLRTHAATVGEFLKEKKVTPGKNDTLSVKSTAPIKAGMKIELWRNGKQTITKEEPLKFTTKTIEDSNRKVGYRQVKEAGVNGAQDVTYEIVMKNGKEKKRKKINSVVTKAAKQEVVVVGTKPDFDGDFAAALAKLRSCEGGYDSINPAGPYYGAYQFDEGSWNANAPAGAKYGDATPAQQDQAARNYYKKSGWSPWPVCGAGLPDTFR